MTLDDSPAEPFKTKRSQGASWLGANRGVRIWSFEGDDRSLAALLYL